MPYSKYVKCHALYFHGRGLTSSAIVDALAAEGEAATRARNCQNSKASSAHWQPQEIPRKWTATKANSGYQGRNDSPRKQG
jgi:hypothetical protein